jgi:hypothetical protein
VRHFVLKPLNTDSVRRSSLASRPGPRPEFVAAVYDASSGRPEFVVELAKACANEHVAPTAKMPVN